MTAINSGQALLKAEKLSFGYRSDKKVLAEVDFAVAAGRFVSILGPNGSGKTTLLRCLLGWLKPDVGVVHLAGELLRSYSYRARARLMGYVPQFPDSAFSFSVRDLVLMGRYARTGSLGLVGRKDMECVDRAMELTETTEFSDRHLNELSGGEAQRVMIARALAQEPQVILLDEPTSHLDLRNQMLIYGLMQRLARQEGMGVVCVSHDINLAGRFADELLLMRGGKVLAHGASKDVVQREILERLYGIELELLDVPGHEIPIVLAQQ